MEKIPLPLIKRLSSIFSQEEMIDLKNTFLEKRRPTTCRVNMLKSTKLEVENTFKKKNIIYQEIPFFDGAYILDSSHSEKDLWKLDIYKQGKIYIQGISSQFPIHIFDTQNTQGLKILDACSAPGGKTSQLSEKYPDAQIYAFEPNKIRYEKMCHNLTKLGCENVITIHDSIENIQEHIENKEYFDVILIDAPCSGEGAMSIHNTKFLQGWDISHIKKNYKRQKRICDSALPYLKTGGECIYSTCTIAPEENEAVIHYLLCNYSDLELRDVNISENKYLKSINALKNFEKYYFKKEISNSCRRIIPNTYSEGFFIAKINKKSS